MLANDQRRAEKTSDHDSEEDGVYEALSDDSGGEANFFGQIANPNTNQNSASLQRDINGKPSSRRVSRQMSKNSINSDRSNVARFRQQSKDDAGRANQKGSGSGSSGENNDEECGGGSQEGSAEESQQKIEKSKEQVIAEAVESIPTVDAMIGRARAVQDRTNDCMETTISNFLKAVDTRVDSIHGLAKEVQREIGLQNQINNEQSEWFQNQAEAGLGNVISEASDAVKSLEKFRELLSGDIQQQMDDNQRCIETCNVIKSDTKRILDEVKHVREYLKKLQSDTDDLALEWQKSVVEAKDQVEIRNKKLEEKVAGVMDNVQLIRQKKKEAICEKLLEDMKRERTERLNKNPPIQNATVVLTDPTGKGRLKNDAVVKEPGLEADSNKNDPVINQYNDKENMNPEPGAVGNSKINSTTELGPTIQKSSGGGTSSGNVVKQNINESSATATANVASLAKSRSNSRGQIASQSGVRIKQVNETPLQKEELDAMVEDEKKLTVRESLSLSRAQNPSEDISNVNGEILTANGVSNDTSAH